VDNRHLTHLNLSYNGIGDNGCITIANSLVNNWCLTHLDLSSKIVFPFCLFVFFGSFFLFLLFFSSPSSPFFLFPFITSSPSSLPPLKVLGVMQLVCQFFFLLFFIYLYLSPLLYVFLLAILLSILFSSFSSLYSLLSLLFSLLA
jgi:hypothetical protein